MSREIALATEARGLVDSYGRNGCGCGSRRPLLSAGRVRYIYPGNVVALDGIDLEVGRASARSSWETTGAGKARS